MNNQRSRRIDVKERSRIHDGFVKLDVVTLRHQRFDGSMSHRVTRELIERRPAAAVLPYDPASDRVVLIEQFRPGAFAAEQPPWLVEVVAGLIDDDETPEAAVRREALEEAGLSLGRLTEIGTFFTSPGVCSERVTCFCGEVTSDGVEGVFGSDAEGEDIRVFSVSGETFATQALNGGLNNVTAAIVGLWFAAMRARGSDFWTR